MTTKAQLQANRQNSLTSSGPKSINGKVIASQNAVKHGLLSKDLLVHDEKPKELAGFCNGIYETLFPQGAMEVLLVERIINTAWRLRRLTKAENEVISHSDDFLHNSSTISKAFKGHNGSCLQLLSRYESALERGLYKALHELQRLQAMRLGQPVMAPIAIQVHSDSEDGSIGFVSQS